VRSSWLICARKPDFATLAISARGALVGDRFRLLDSPISASFSARPPGRERSRMQAVGEQGKIAPAAIASRPASHVIVEAAAEHEIQCDTAVTGAVAARAGSAGSPRGMPITAITSSIRNIISVWRPHRGRRMDQDRGPGQAYRGRADKPRPPLAGCGSEAGSARKFWRNSE